MGMASKVRHAALGAGALAAAVVLLGAPALAQSSPIYSSTEMMGGSNPMWASPTAEVYYGHGGTAVLLGGMVQRNLTDWLYIGAKAVAGPAYNSYTLGGLSYAGPRLGVQFGDPRRFSIGGNVLAGLTAGFGPAAISGFSGMLLPTFNVQLGAGPYALGFGGGYMVTPNMPGMEGQYWGIGVGI